MTVKIDELVVELNARTERLEQGLAKARAEIGKTGASAAETGNAGSFMGLRFEQAGAKIAGGASIAALAIAGMAVAAAKMAIDIDANLRKVEARVPQTVGRIGELRDAIREMSLDGPNSQVALSAAAAEIARQGVGSLEEIQARLSAVVKVADATGEDITGIVAGLDQAMDLFGLDAKDTESFLAKLYATAANRMPITDLFDALQSAAPTIHEFGLDSDTAARALGALLEQGKSARQAGTELKAYATLGKDGAAEVRKLASSYGLASDALAKLNAAQAEMNGGVESMGAKVKNNLNAIFINLGSVILPTVNAELAGMVGILEHLNGTVGKIKSKADIASMIAGFSASGAGVSAIDLQKQVYHAAEMARDRKLDLGGLSVAELDRMSTNITAVTTATGTAIGKFVSLTDAIAKARAEAAKLESASGAPKKPGPASRTSEQVKADQDAATERQKKWTELLDKASKSAIAAGIEFQKYVDENSTKFWESYRDRLADVMDDLVDTTRNGFTGMRAAAASGMVTLPAGFDDAEKRAIRAAMAMREAEIEFDRLAQMQARGAEGTAENLRALEASAQKLSLARAEAKAGSAQWKQLGDELKKVQEAITKIVGGVADATGGKNDAVRSTTEALMEQARTLQQAVDGALQLAEAFGVVDKNAAGALRSVAQIAGNLPALSSAWGKRDSAAKGEGMGALVGAALPVAGAAASLIGGLLSSAKAAREHAAAVMAASREFTKSLQDRIAGAGLNEQQAREQEAAKKRPADLNTLLDTLVQAKGIRIGTRDEFLAKDTAGQRSVLTGALARAQQQYASNGDTESRNLIKALEEAIKQFDLVGEAASVAAKQMEEELAAKRKDIDQSLAERRLRVADRTDEADAAAFMAAREKELADARAGGVYTPAQIADLKAIIAAEKEKYLADAQKRRDDEAAQKAQDAARRKEDLQTAIDTADGETPAEKARRRDLEKRRELEDAMRAGADAEELALIKLRQAAEDARDASAEAAAAAQAELDLATKRRDIDRTYAERRLRVQDLNTEADALAFVRQQEEELAAARADGVHTASQIADLESLLADERVKYLADQKKRLDEEAAAKARQVARDREDLQTRINAADGETPAEVARRRALEKERELLDWMAKGADSATLALVSLAQAADDAAAAQQAATAAQRELQDLDVELLRLQGKTAEADAAALEHELQRRWEDAVARGDSPEALAKLAEVIAARRAQGVAPASAASGAASGGAAASDGATSAIGVGFQSLTTQQGDRMGDYLRKILTVAESSHGELVKQTAALTWHSGWSIQPPAIPAEYRPAAAASMAGATVIQLGGIRVQVVAPEGADPGTFGRAIASAVLRDVNRGISQATIDAVNIGLANASLLTAQGRGDVSR